MTARRQQHHVNWQDTIKELLVRGAANHVTVFKAPPGSGKTNTMSEALRELAAAGQLRRVLWFTPNTHQKGERESLAQEIARKFQSAPKPMNVQIIHGSEHFKPKSSASARKVYREQFVWPDQPQVKILSHAYLSLLYGSVPTAQSQARRRLVFRNLLKDVDLLVIDEDPTETLIIKSLSTLNHDHFATAPDAVSAALHRLMRKVLSDAHGSWLPFKYSQGPHKGSWTGATFLQAFAAELGDLSEPQAAWDAFARHLHQRHQQIVLDALRDDLASPTLGSQRFGLAWFAWGTSIDTRTLVFRYDVLTPLQRLPPTFVLDAYAHPAYYDRVFGNQAGTSVRRPVTVVPLRDDSLARTGEDIHTLHASWMHLDRKEVRRGKAPDNDYFDVERVMLEVAAFTKSSHTQKSVVLVYKNMIDSLHPLAEKYCGQLGLPGDAIVFQHWFSGRGSNAFIGRNIFALTEPHFPRSKREHTLAALYPTDAPDRAEAAENLRQTEILQLLHRNRQIHLRKARKLQPHVVIAFPFHRDTNVTEAHRRMFTTLLPEQMRIHRLRERELIGQVCEELLDQFGAIPLVALMALGLFQPHGQYVELSSQLRQRLLGWKTLSKGRTPLLAAWRKNPALFTDAIAIARREERRAGRKPSQLLPYRNEDIKRILERHFGDDLRRVKTIRKPASVKIQFDDPSKLVVWVRKIKGDKTHQAEADLGNAVLWKLLGGR